MVDGLEEPAVDCALLELVPLSLVKAGRNGEDRQSSVEESRWRRDVAVSGKLSLCLQPADCDRALKAVYDRHGQVHQNNVESSVGFEEAKGVATMLGSYDSVSLHLQPLLQDHPVDEFVLDNEDTERRRSSRRGRF